MVSVSGVFLVNISEDILDGVTCTPEEYRNHCDNFDGLCLACFEWTSGGVEPDAENYPCPHCDQARVVGAEDAMIMGFINVPD